MELFIGFVVGVLVGGLLVSASRDAKAPLVGDLRIDNSDPYDGPYMFLEITKDRAILYNSKQVTLNVNTESYIR